MITSNGINLERLPSNPIITPNDIKPSFADWEVIGAFNAGVAQYGKEIILLLRIAERPIQSDPDYLIVPVLDDQENEKVKQVKIAKHDPAVDLSDPRVVVDRQGRTLYLTSISHFRVARSLDGKHFTVDEKPTVWPEGELESWGIEDPRITFLEDRYYITYSAISDKGVSVGCLTTKDFHSFQREGTILAPTNKDVVLFPERIDGYYYMLHRPVPNEIGRPEMWIARSPDLKHWGDHRFLIGLRDNGWEDARIGAGCVPIKTDEGWLVLYHGANAAHQYSMGAVLLDLSCPERVIARSDKPFMIPETDYEKNGFFGHVVFACGAIIRDENVQMYYGASDDCMASVSFSLHSLLNELKRKDKS